MLKQTVSPKLINDTRRPETKKTEKILHQIERFIRWAIKSPRLASGLGLIVVIVIVAIVTLVTHTPNPVPGKIQQSVSFPVYYPAASKLPASYMLEKNSFSAGGNAVIFKVSGPNNTELIFSEQPKPSANDIQNFNSVRIPLHSTFNTKIGMATIGAIGNSSVISLPTNGATWIIITAPYAINQQQLNQILDSIID